MNNLEIYSNIHSYSVLFEKNLDFIKQLIDDPVSVFVIDKNIYEKYSASFDACDNSRLLVIESIEPNKDMEGVFQIYRFLVNKKSKKNTHLISIGGGIIQDISGFAASTLYRGIKWTFIPTTLLAQADSCVGSKTSLNFEQYKNILGSFYPPHFVRICSQFLNTLSENELNSGKGEIIKFMLLDDTKNVDFSFVKEIISDAHKSGDYNKAIQQSLSVKQSYIKQDEFDTGKRNLFNYGHCFGHALEYTSQYRIPHGIAVIYGMIFANIVAEKRGLVSRDFCLTLFNDLFANNISVPVKVNEIEGQGIIDALKKDKKRIGNGLAMIIPSSNNVNAIKITDLTELEVCEGINQFKNDLSIKV